MLVIPDNSPHSVNLVGCDPGTDTLGTGIINIDIGTLEINYSRARTYKASRHIRHDWNAEWQGDRQARLLWHEENLYRLFVLEQAFMVATEAPFFSYLHPGAYEPLVQTVDVIRRAVRRYDPWKVLQEIDPPTVKNAVGAKGGDKKDPVREGLLKYPGLNFQGEVPLEAIDEHSCDALAVTLCLLHRLRGGVLS